MVGESHPLVPLCLSQWGIQTLAVHAAPVPVCPSKLPSAMCNSRRTCKPCSQCMAARHDRLLTGNHAVQAAVPQTLCPAAMTCGVCNALCLFRRSNSGGRAWRMTGARSAGGAAARRSNERCSWTRRPVLAARTAPLAPLTPSSW